MKTWQGWCWQWPAAVFEMGVWAVVPVKELDRAKERLAAVLPPERRRALMLAMLEDVLTALAATPGLDGLAVVTPVVWSPKLQPKVTTASPTS